METPIILRYKNAQKVPKPGQGLDKVVFELDPDGLCSKGDPALTIVKGKYPADSQWAKLVGQTMLYLIIEGEAEFRFPNMENQSPLGRYDFAYLPDGCEYSVKGDFQAIIFTTPGYMYSKSH